MLATDPKLARALTIAGMINRGETERLALIDQYHAAMGALLAATDKSRARNTSPHPVHARNSGLLDAWDRWPGAYMTEAPPLLEERMRDPAFCFSDNERLVADVFASDPVVAGTDEHGMMETLKASTMVASVAVMFWQRPHALIELTPALDQLLASSDISQEIPASLLRPPVPACYISFGAATQAAVARSEVDQEGRRVVGAYVFESAGRGGRIISICPVSQLDSGIEWFLGHIEIVIDDEADSLLEITHRARAAVALSPSSVREQTAIAQFCATVFLYWSMAHARRIEDGAYTRAMARLRAVGPKKAAKLRRHVAALYDRFVLGPATLPIDLEIIRGDVSPHWRRGHFRMQAHGPQSALRKVIFIAPTLVRADRLEEHKSARPQQSFLRRSL